MSDHRDTRRRALDAATRFGRVAARLRAEARDAPYESVRSLAGYEAEALLESVLWDAEDLVAALGEDQDGEDVERRARALVAALRSRRLARALEQTSGRTEEEATSFLAMARRLREGSS